MIVKHFLPKTLIFLAVLLGFGWSVRGRPVQAPALSAVSANEGTAAFILPLSETTYLPLRNFNVDEPILAAKAGGLWDADSGKLLYGKNIDERLPIASLTKLLTAVVVLEHLPLNTPYTAATEDINVDGNGADLAVGETLKGGDLLKLLLIKSSNDAALVFSRAAATQNINLVAKMNEKARSLGMVNSRFSDPAGLSDEDAYSTISDLVKLVRYVDRYPLLWEILVTVNTDITALTGQSHQLINTNQLLGELPGIVGGKTGYTEGAGQTMVLQVNINNGRERLISIILGSPDRFAETKQLINWGLAAYRW